MTKCNMDWVSEPKEVINGKTGEIRVKSGLVNSIVPMLVSQCQSCTVVI